MKIYKIQNVTMRNIFVTLCFAALFSFAFSSCQSRKQQSSLLSSSSYVVADSDTVVADPELAEKVEKDKADFVGTYYCARTHDVFYFDADGKGYFRAGSEIAHFEWMLNDNMVTLVYMEEGKVLDSKTLILLNKVLIDKSEMFGELQFVKEE